MTYRVDKPRPHPARQREYEHEVMVMNALVAVYRGRNPFDLRGTVTADDGLRRYGCLPASLMTMLAQRVAEHPGAEAVVVVEGLRLTYRQLYDGAARVAGGLRDSGTCTGDRVAILLTSGVSWVLAFFRAVFAGAILVLVNTRLTGPEVHQVLADAKPRVVLAPDSALPDGDAPVVDQPSPTDVAVIFFALRESLARFVEAGRRSRRRGRATGLTPTRVPTADSVARERAQAIRRYHLAIDWK